MRDPFGSGPAPLIHRRFQRQLVLLLLALLGLLLACSERGRSLRIHVGNVDLGVLLQLVVLLLGQQGVTHL